MNKFRRRLALVFITLVGCSVLISGLYTARILKESHISTLQDSMLREIRLILATVDWKTDITFGEQIEYFEQQAGYYKEFANARVTFIDRDGRVLGDSDHKASTMDNHIMREEVQQALASKNAGYSIRYSDTVKQNMLYTAFPVIENDELIGYMRLALSLQDVEEVIAQLWMYLIVGLGLLFGITGLVSYRLAQGLTRPLEKITGVAQQITRMNYDSRVQVSGKDEVGQLAKAINTMASSLQLQMNRISENEGRLKSVLDNMISGVVMIDEQGKIVLLNRTAEEMLGLPSTKIMGKDYTVIKQHFDFVKLIEECMERRELIREEIVFFFPEEQVLDVNLVPMEASTNQWTGMVIVLHDITEIRRLEKMRSEFVANVSHELKTPIAAVKGFAETLLAGALDDKDTARSFLQIIFDESERLNRLIVDILELSKIESRRIPLHFSPVHVQSLMSKSMGMMAEEARKKQISLDIQVDEDIYIEADEDRLRQIVINLLSNGINYSPEGGRVKARVYTLPFNDQDEKEWVRIDIIDTGMGIPKKDLPRIFERFYRVDKARSRSSGGTGLGLSIVKHLVELHKGSISVKSEVGMGTTFSIQLPVIH
jgi:two-component system phosphate regulon sensor histidine kinase PhoR